MSVSATAMPFGGSGPANQQQQQGCISAALRELDELESFVHSWHRTSRQGLAEQYLRFAAAISAMKENNVGDAAVATTIVASPSGPSEVPSSAASTNADSAAPTAASIAAKALNKDAPVFRPYFGGNNSNNVPSTPTGPAAIATINTNTPAGAAAGSNGASLRQHSTVSSATNGGFDWESLMSGGGSGGADSNANTHTSQITGGGHHSSLQGTANYSDPLSLHTTAPNSPSAITTTSNSRPIITVGAAAASTAPGSFTVASTNNTTLLSRQPSNLIMRSNNNNNNNNVSVGALPSATTNTNTVRVGNNNSNSAAASASGAHSVDHHNTSGADYDSFLDDYMSSNNNQNQNQNQQSIRIGNHHHTSSSMNNSSSNVSASLGVVHQHNTHHQQPSSLHLHHHHHQNQNSSNQHGFVGGMSSKSNNIPVGPSALESSLLNMSGASSNNGGGPASVTVAGTRSTVAPPSPTVVGSAFVGGSGGSVASMNSSSAMASPSYGPTTTANNSGQNNNGTNNISATGGGFANVTSASQLHALGATSCQVLVEFKRKRVLQFESKEFVTAGEFVVVGGDRGEDIGVVTHVWPTGSQEPTGAWNGNIGIGKVLRPATLLEISQLQGVQFELESRAVEVAQEKVVEHQLPMRIVDAEYQFDRKKLTFYYQSNHRLDFRNLVRDLYKTFRARIWMEQD